MSRRSIIAATAFALMTLAEIGDAIGLIITLADPAPVAAQLGISTRAEIVRASLLLGLALAIAADAALALAGLLTRRSLLFALGALNCALFYVVYGVYQCISALAQLGSPAIAATGLVYIGLGALAFWLGRTAFPSSAKMLTS
jgi:hypothetical protein